jgi:ankyrin repeat protein
VGVQALREFDGWDEAGELVHLLSQFDAFIKKAAGMRGPIGEGKLENAAADGEADRVRELLAAGAKPNITALTWGVSKGSLETVRLLLDAGIACDARDCYGVTPVFFAAGAGNGEICPFLINPDDSPPGKSERTRIVPGHTEILRLLMDRGAPFDEPFVAEPPYKSAGATPLIVAAAFGHDAAVLELRERGARVKAVDNQGRSAADWAARAGHRKLAGLLNQ